MNSAAPELQVDIALQDPEWEESIPDLMNMVMTVVKTAIKTATLPEPARGKKLEVSILLANDDLISILNKEYRDKEGPTNILTFATLDNNQPQGGDVLGLGDVILSYQTIKREAKEQEKFLRDHITHLIVHGVLHLLGYDHIEENDATIMESMEIRILERLGVQNPYTEKIFIV